MKHERIYELDRKQEQPQKLYISWLVKYRDRKRWRPCKITSRRVVHFVASSVKVRGAVKGQTVGV